MGVHVGLQKVVSLFSGMNQVGFPTVVLRSTVSLHMAIADTSQQPAYRVNLHLVPNLQALYV